MKSIIAALAAIAATVVSAQSNIVTSQPGTSQVYQAGSTLQIVWNPVSGTIATIDLREGAATALAFVQNIATNVSAQAGTYSWAIPATLKSGTDYGISFGNPPDVSYSPMFTIQGASGAPAATTAGTSSPAAAGASSSAAPVAASSAAVSPAASPAAATPKAAASSSAAASPAPTSGANKNVAAVGAMAVAGAVAAALL